MTERKSLLNLARPKESKIRFFDEDIPPRLCPGYAVEDLFAYFDAQEQQQLFPDEEGQEGEEQSFDEEQSNFSSLMPSDLMPSGQPFVSAPFEGEESSPALRQEQRPESQNGFFVEETPFVSDPQFAPDFLGKQNPSFEDQEKLPFVEEEERILSSFPSHLPDLTERSVEVDSFSEDVQTGEPVHSVPHPSEMRFSLEEDSFSEDEMPLEEGEQGKEEEDEDEDEVLSSVPENLSHLSVQEEEKASKNSLEEKLFPQISTNFFDFDKDISASAEENRSVETKIPSDDSLFSGGLSFGVSQAVPTTALTPSSHPSQKAQSESLLIPVSEVAEKHSASEDPLPKASSLKRVLEKSEKRKESLSLRDRLQRNEGEAPAILSWDREDVKKDSQKKAKRKHFRDLLKTPKVGSLRSRDEAEETAREAKEEAQAQKRAKEQKAAEEAQAQKRAKEQKAAEEAQAQKRAKEQKAAEEALAQKHAKEQKAAEEAQAQKRAKEQKAKEEAQAQKHVKEQKAAEEAQAQKRAKEQKAKEEAQAQKRVKEQKAAEEAQAHKRAKEQKAAEEALAHKRAKEQKARQKEVLKSAANKKAEERRLKRQEVLKEKQVQKKNTKEQKERLKQLARARKQEDSKASTKKKEKNPQKVAFLGTKGGILTAIGLFVGVFVGGYFLKETVMETPNASVSADSQTTLSQQKKQKLGSEGANGPKEASLSQAELIELELLFERLNYSFDGLVDGLLRKESLAQVAKLHKEFKLAGKDRPTKDLLERLYEQHEALRKTNP